MTYGVLPEELAEVRVVRNFRSYSEALLLQVLEPSPDRVEPRCPIFARCSGCQYQHLAYPAQLAWKRRHVEDALTRIARLPLPEGAVSPTAPSPLQYHYRTKLTPHPQEPPPPGHRRHAAPKGGRRHRAEMAADPIGFVEEAW